MIGRDGQRPITPQGQEVVQEARSYNQEADWPLGLNDYARKASVGDLETRVVSCSNGESPAKRRNQGWESLEAEPELEAERS